MLVFLEQPSCSCGNQGGQKWPCLVDIRDLCALISDCCAIPDHRCKEVSSHWCCTTPHCCKSPLPPADITAKRFKRHHPFSSLYFPFLPFWEMDRKDWNIQKKLRIWGKWESDCACPGKVSEKSRDSLQLRTWTIRFIFSTNVAYNNQQDKISNKKPWALRRGETDFSSYYITSFKCLVCFFLRFYLFVRQRS